MDVRTLRVRDWLYLLAFFGLLVVAVVDHAGSIAYASLALCGIVMFDLWQVRSARRPAETGRRPDA